MKNRKAQSTLEYIILVTVIILALITVLNSTAWQNRIGRLFGKSDTEATGKRLKQTSDWLLK